MKKVIITILALSGIVSGGAAQDLRLPATPAFSILGYEPASVMRPTSIKKLSSDVLTSFDEDGKLLMNLGLEVTPYWLSNRITLERKEYLNPSLIQAIKQTFTISAATVRDSVTNTDNLGVGIRFAIIKGRLSPEFKDADALMNRLETYMSAVIAAGNGQPGNPANNAVAVAQMKIFLQNASKGEDPELVDEILGVADSLKQNTYADVTEFCKEVAESCEEKSKSIAERIIKLEEHRLGFSLEAAAAAKFVTSKTDQSLQKGGFWLNASYNEGEKNNWNATARLLASASDTLRVNTDIGFSYVRQEKDFNVSVEGMLRWYRAEIPDVNLAGEFITRVEKDFTYRLAAQASYTLTEGISANLTIGKDFEDPALETAGLFSIVGLNYSIFNRNLKVK